MTGRPKFSVAMAIFDVQRYLPAALQSLEYQTLGLDNMEIFLIDDGSTDSSGRIARQWADRHPGVHFLEQENAGAGAARNLAIKAATGEWFTTVDADDILRRDYFELIAEFLRRDEGGRVSVIGPNFQMLNDQTGRYRDGHSLSRKFRHGERLARLADEPEAFVLGTPFLRLDVLHQFNLFYDQNIRPTFEDAHLIGRYLSHMDDPVAGIVPRAHYYYRRRVEQDSLTVSSWSAPERFTIVPRSGYLDLLEYTAQWLGKAPRWAQYMVLYDLLWYFKEEQSTPSKVGWVDGAVSNEFMTTLDLVMQHIDTAAIEEIPCNPVPWAMRQSLLARFKDDGISPRVFRWRDTTDGMVQATILHRGPAPEFTAFRDGTAVDHLIVGSRLHEYYGHEFMIETSLRWPSGETVALWVDGVPVVFRQMQRITWGKPPAAAYKLSKVDHVPQNKYVRKAATVRRIVSVAAMATSRSKPIIAARIGHEFLARYIDQRREAGRSRRVKLIKERARSSDAQERYRDAWIIMDRPGVADDNGEHLYRYLMRNRPDINAFFLLERKSLHWGRLAAEGFRLVEYGSDESALITLNSAVRLSSDAVEECMYPVSRKEFGDPPGFFVFLQHGVLKDDISRWINGKQINLVITTTKPEHESFVGPRSTYRFTSEQVAQTGLPRYDRLQLLVSEGMDRGGVLIMPTWRFQLRETLSQCRSENERRQAFEASHFGSAWLSVLRSPAAAELAELSGEPFRLMFHSGLDRVVPELDLPDWVIRVNPGAVDFQRELVRSRLLLTDYTSVAFDAVYVGIPVVYFQFDQDEMFGGLNTLRQGYFDYNRDAFGPVVETEGEFIEQALTVARRGFTMDPLYEARANSAFTYRDGGNCERVVDAVMRRLLRGRSN